MFLGHVRNMQRVCQQYIELEACRAAVRKLTKCGIVPGTHKVVEGSRTGMPDNQELQAKISTEIKSLCGDLTDAAQWLIDDVKQFEEDSK